MAVTGLSRGSMNTSTRNRRSHWHGPAVWLAFVMLSFGDLPPAQAGEVEVADPYIEMRTGPGRGYPVFHVGERGERIELLSRKTSWYRVRTARGIEGWVDRAQLERTLGASGEPVRIGSGSFDDYQTRRWEFGAFGGEFGGAGTITLSAVRVLSPGLHGEISLAHVLGRFSDSLIAGADLMALPAPEWRVAPYFLVGTGIIDTRPHTVLVQARDGQDQLSHAGIGVRAYLTRHVLARIEYRYHVIFTSRDDNEEVSEWKAGFSVFF